jgi:hypothetical protein
MAKEKIGMKVHICILVIILTATQIHAQTGGGGSSSSGSSGSTAPATGGGQPNAGQQNVAPPNSASQPLQPNTPPLQPNTPPLQPNPPPLQPNNPVTPATPGAPDTPYPNGGGPNQNVNAPATPGAPPNTGYGLTTNNGLVGAYPNAMATNGVPGGINTNSNWNSGTNQNGSVPRRHWWNR